jgi:hypothetical protein
MPVPAVALTLPVVMVTVFPKVLVPSLLLVLDDFLPSRCLRARPIVIARGRVEPVRGVRSIDQRRSGGCSRS